MPNFDPQTVQLIIVAAVALALLLQTIFLLAILVIVRKQARSAREDVADLRTELMPIIADLRTELMPIIADLRTELMPIIHNTRELVARVAPRVEEAAGDLSAIAHNLRTQASDVQSSATEVIERFRRQASRVDAMTTTILDAIDHAGGLMTDAVAKPTRQISALLAFVRAAVESLRSSEPPPQPQPTHIPGDKDMFV